MWYKHTGIIIVRIKNTNDTRIEKKKSRTRSERDDDGFGFTLFLVVVVVIVVIIIIVLPPVITKNKRIVWIWTRQKCVKNGSVGYFVLFLSKNLRPEMAPLFRTSQQHNLYHLWEHTKKTLKQHTTRQKKRKKTRRRKKWWWWRPTPAWSAKATRWKR